jgi:hypothetical protein
MVGLQPGVVSALIEVGADIDGLRTAIDLDAAFELLEPTPESEVVSVETDSWQDFASLTPEQIPEDER